MIIFKKTLFARVFSERSALLALVLVSLLGPVPSFGSRALLDLPEIKVHPSMPAYAKDIQIPDSRECCSDLINLRSSAFSNRSASVSLKTLYSAEAGSWMFESLVHNGLFTIASGYQPSHPKAVMIENGTIDLRQLTDKLHNQHILEPIQSSSNEPTDKSGYRLHYPLIIGSNATLFIEDSNLEMNSQTGSALVNLGRIVVRNSTLQTVKKDARGGKHFRPFILSWNGSETAIINSELRRLGYNKYLSQGLTLANHTSLKRNNRARLLVSDSLMTGLESGPIASNADLLIEHSTIEDTQRYGIDAADGLLAAVGNTITITRYNNGIRATNMSSTFLKGNRVSQTHRSGVLITGNVKHAVIVANYIDNAGSDGIEARDIKQIGTQPVFIHANVLIRNAKSGIRVSRAPSVRITDNSLIANDEYAINIDDTHFVNRTPLIEVVPMVIAGNRLSSNRAASIKTAGAGKLLLARNEFRMTPLLQSVFVGDLASMQAILLNHLITNKDVIEIIP